MSDQEPPGVQNNVIKKLAGTSPTQEAILTPLTNYSNPFTHTPDHPESPIDQTSPQSPQEQTLHDWMERIKQNVVIVNRHGKIDPAESGSKDYGTIYAKPDKYQYTGSMYLPRPEIPERQIESICNVYDIKKTYPLVTITNLTVGGEKPDIASWSFLVFNYQAMQATSHPNERRGPTSLNFSLYFPPKFGRQFAQALEEQTVPADIFLKLYDDYYPPENAQHVKRQKYQEFAPVGPDKPLNVIQADITTQPNPDPNAIYKTIKVVSNVNHFTVPFMPPRP